MRARRADLVEKQVGDELVLFDTRDEHVHLLNATLTAVWRRCSTGATHDDLVEALRALLGPVDGIDELVAAAIADLSRARLLEPDVPSTFGGVVISRRSLLKKAGIAALAMPAITTILAPPVAASHSGVPCLAGGQPCTTGTHAVPCCGGSCQNTRAGLRCCSARLGEACDARTTTCCEGACTKSFCCNQISGSCAPGQHDQCCDAAVCNTSGVCVACTPSGTAPTNGDATLCCKGEIRNGVCK